MGQATLIEVYFVDQRHFYFNCVTFIFFHFKSSSFEIFVVIEDHIINISALYWL